MKISGYLLVTICLLGSSGSVYAGESLSGWIDLRTSTSNGETGWRAGGFGKLRDGGQTALGLAQAGLIWTPRISDNVTANIDLRYDEGSRATVSEAFFRWKPVPKSPLRYSLRAGQMFVPLSLEHDGAGWTTMRTVTPSALNSWIGEEGLVDGAEATLQNSIEGHGVGATVGLFMGGDTAGTMLTFRGWAMHDQASGNAVRLNLPESATGGWAQVFTLQAAQSKPLVEIDGRAGTYLRLDWRPPAPVAFYLFAYNNPGKPTEVRHGQYAWTTRFVAGGLRWQATQTDEVLVQGLGGTTMMGGSLPDGRHPADIAYDAAYVLLCHTVDNGSRFTGRLDYFGIKDHSMRLVDDNTDKGYALTLAWTKPLNDHLDITVEGVNVTSNRPARVTHMVDPRQSQTSLQIALKAHF